MKNTYPSYYKDFACIADKCPDTCCAGWQIVVDAESAAKYRCANGEIGDKLRKSMAIDDDGDTVFVSHNRRCPFLQNDNLCKIYIELGKEALCKTCTLFPRFVTDLGGRKETGLSLSCPEAARLHFANDMPLTFETVEEDSPVQPNSIDPTLYFTLLKAQKTAINILQNRKYPVNRRLIAFLRFCDEVQAKIRAKDLSEISAEEEYFLPVSASLSKAKRALNRYADILKTLEKLDADWNSELNEIKILSHEKAESFAAVLLQNEYEAEHLAVYFAFRYFMTAAFDKNLASKSRFTVFSVLICLILEASLPDFNTKSARIEAIRRYSKEIEHSAENMDAVFTAIKKSRFFGSDNLINILSCEYQPKEK